MLAGTPEPTEERVVAVPMVIVPAPAAEEDAAVVIPDATSDDGHIPSPPYTNAMVRKLRIAELREELERRGLATDGRKAACRKRLWEFVKAKAAAAALIPADQQPQQQLEEEPGGAGDAGEAGDGESDDPPATVTKTRGRGRAQISLEWSLLPDGITTDVRTAPRSNAAWSGRSAQIIDSMNEMDCWIAAYPGALAGLRACWANSNAQLTASVKKFGFGEWLVCWGLELEIASMQGTIHTLFHDKVQPFSLRPAIAAGRRFGVSKRRHETV